MILQTLQVLEKKLYPIIITPFPYLSHTSPAAQTVPGQTLGEAPGHGGHTAGGAFQLGP